MDALIQLLADGDFHAGDELGDALGVSRAAVWKQVQKLHALGLDVQSVKGKGYRLPQPLELLEANRIRELIAPPALRLLTDLTLLVQTQSTNDVAMSRIQAGMSSGFVCLAEQQTAGRGRRGREWVSPFASNLYLSCVWEFYHGAAALEGLSLAVGVAVARALRSLQVSDVKLKWPNDVLVSGAKIAGILLEMTGDPTGRCQVVVGIGINHLMPASAGAQIDQPWVRLAELCPSVSRNLLAARVISEVLLALEAFQLDGFESFRAEWSQLDAYKGLPVIVKTGAQDILGIADGVDETGGLRLLGTDGLLQVMKGGELSLRLQP